MRKLRLRTCEVCGGLTARYRCVHPDSGKLAWVCDACESWCQQVRINRDREARQGRQRAETTA